MYCGKYQNSNIPLKKYKKPAVLLASFLLILSVAAGTTLSFLIDGTSRVENTFQPASVEVQITENFDHQTKSDITITNNGNIPVYIRATLVMYWIDSNGVIVEPKDCTYSTPVISNKWIPVGDIYYYSQPVAAGGVVRLLESGTAITAHISPENADYKFVVEVLTEAIQAEPSAAVADAWKDVSVDSNGNLTH